MDTIAALATPEGEGGIAVIRISGSEAFKVASEVFTPQDAQKTLSAAKGYTAMFGHFIKENKVRDEVVALCFRAPRSYTGEDVVELSCHGGEVVCNMLLHELYKNGAVPALRGEFTKRAFLNGRISLTEAEGVMDMIAASGERAVDAAADAMRGNLYKSINAVRERLITQSGHIAAYTDYPEEDVEQPLMSAIVKELSLAQLSLQELCCGYGKSAIIKNGVRAAIIGGVNVGKSTLLNLLAGFERCIVTNKAGTTRDVIETDISIAGIRLVLSDTAGLRDTDDPIEAEGVRRSYENLDKAQLIIAVFDAERGISAEDIRIAARCKDKAAIAVINKLDINAHLDTSEIAPYFRELIYISAKEQASAATVEKAVESVLNLCEQDSQEVLLASERQYVAAQKANEALKAAIAAAGEGFTLDAVGVCIDDALGALYELTGESASEDVISEVFAKFCVGK